MRTIYLVLTTVVALLALLLAAVAALRAQGQQPALVGMSEYGVLLTGGPEVPVIVTGNGRTIIGFSPPPRVPGSVQGGALNAPLAASFLFRSC